MVKAIHKNGTWKDRKANKNKDPKKGEKEKNQQTKNSSNNINRNPGPQAIEPSAMEHRLWQPCNFGQTHVQGKPRKVGLSGVLFRPKSLIVQMMTSVLRAGQRR